MKSKKNKLLGALASFWFFSCLSIVMAFAIAISIYRYKFGGALSGQSSDWSNFGSYVGGVFGPLVSFVTLLAVLKTVYLQRELLDSQQLEFDRMSDLQRHTLKDAADDARKLQVSAARDTAVKVIDQHISIYERSFDRHHENAYRFTESMDQRSTDESDEAFLSDILLHRDLSRKAVDKLCQLSVKLAIVDFQSVDDVRRGLELGLDELKKDIAYEKNRDA